MRELPTPARGVDVRDGLACGARDWSRIGSNGSIECMACAVPEVGRPPGWPCASTVSETMPGKRSVGLLVYRRRLEACEVFLVHPGDPFWHAKDSGAWSIPKGEPPGGENPLDAARREFAEETGFEMTGDFRPLAPIKQRGGKIIAAWAVEGDCDPAEIRSNTFTTEWPPHSGHVREFPEVDRAAWFPIDDAGRRITAGQRGLLDNSVNF